MEDTAADFVQIAFERILKQRDRFEQEPFDIVPYAKTIIKHLYIDHYRAYRRHGARSIDENSPTHVDVSAVRELEYAVTLGQIRLRAEKSLSKECLDILKLKVRGYKYAEIAKKLGIKKNSVSSKLFRCRMQFKEIWDDFA